MSPTAWFLYAVTVLIWGSTWIGITFQLGKVDPLVSVIYRFALATAVLFAWCRFKRAPLSLSLGQHGWIALQGACLFAINYWLIYHAELYLTSGIVAVLFATLSFMNMLNGRVFFGRPLSGRMMGGALLGVAGVGVLFWPEVQHLSFEDRAVKGAVFALASTYVASLGNVVAGHNARFRLPVITGNAWGMLYGTLLLLGIAFAKGVPFAYPHQLSYTLSLLYLAMFGVRVRSLSAPYCPHWPRSRRLQFHGDTRGGAPPVHGFRGLPLGHCSARGTRADRGRQRAGVARAALSVAPCGPVSTLHRENA